MGYTTDFEGSVTVSPPLSPEEVEFFNKFNNTRRMDRKSGPYCVDGTGAFGQDPDEDVLRYNEPPAGQPGLWCQWQASEDGTEISWDGGEKFYNAFEWMIYVIEHFIGSNPAAKSELPFLQGHSIEGEIFAEGEEDGDLWKIEVRGGIVSRVEGHVSPGPVHVPLVVDKLAAVRVSLKEARKQWDAQVQRRPHLVVSRETFEIFLRDLEEATGIR